MSLQLIQKYFPGLSVEQMNRFEQLLPLYKDWNAKINVISRKDIDSLYSHHVLHALTMIPFYSFVSGATILDLGTGGGFPGIPLAIYYPNVQFTLIDGTAKKIRVVQSVVSQLDLKNVRAIPVRSEVCKEKFDMVVTRAVAKSKQLLAWGKPLLKKKHKHAYPNGIIALKGGNIREELSELDKGEYYEIHKISDCFSEPYFEDKCVLYMQG